MIHTNNIKKLETLKNKINFRLTKELDVDYREYITEVVPENAETDYLYRLYVSGTRVTYDLLEALIAITGDQIPHVMAEFEAYQHYATIRLYVLVAIDDDDHTNDLPY